MAKAEGLTWTIDDADHMTQAEIYGEVLTQLALKNTKIVALTTDLAPLHEDRQVRGKIPSASSTSGSPKPNMVGVASGMAETGLIPVISTFAVFASLRAAEFVRTDLCYQKRNVKIIATHSGTVVRPGRHDAPLHRGPGGDAQLRQHDRDRAGGRARDRQGGRGGAGVGRARATSASAAASSRRCTRTSTSTSRSARPSSCATATT